MQAVGPTFSEQWYRVATLHPRLHPHVRMLRHRYRGEIWHVLDDPVRGRQHRLNPAAWALVARLDGSSTLQQVWDTVVAELGSLAPTQPEVLALLGQLHAQELIASEASPDLDGMFAEDRQRRRLQALAQRNPLSWRVPLFNPSRWLEPLLPLARALFSRPAAALWLLAVGLAALAAAAQGDALAAYAARHLGSPGHWLMLWLAFPLVKALHEAAHALAVRRWGGEVGEVGVTLMLLMPVPYVDASAASAFRERHRRIIVSLAGIACELALAALAFAVWRVVADGWVRELAFAVMLIGTVSTLLFNGNPLVRMDAYHALADALESPGLAPRSRAYWLYLARRHLLGLARTRPPAAAAGEVRWLLAYGAASPLYQWLLAAWVVNWLLGVQWLLGLLALAWFVALLVLLPGWKLWRWARTSAELQERRPRALAVGGALALLPLLLLAALPLPDATRAEGVVWLPENALVRAGGDGFAALVLAEDGAEVAAGTPLVQLHDPTLLAEEQALQQRLGRLQSAYQAAVFHQPAQAVALGEQLRQLQAEADRLAQRRAALTLRAPSAGRVVLVRPADLPGSFLARGEVVAQVLPLQGSTVRVVVAQDDVARLAQPLGAIGVRLAQQPGQTWPAQTVAQVPAATLELPSPLLGDRHAGPFATDPQDERGLRTLQPVFTLDLALPAEARLRPGGRAWVRFDHGARPLAWQWLRRLRQLLLGHLQPG